MILFVEIAPTNRNKSLSPFKVETTNSIIPPDLVGSYGNNIKIANDTCDITVLNKRTEKDINRDVNIIIRSVTAKMDTLPVGTFKYKIFKYPSDVDIFEHLDECCTFNISKMKAAKTIQLIVRTITANPDGTMIFTHFKAGYDERYKVYTGTVNDNVDDYDPVLIRRDISNLHDSKLLECSQYHNFISLVKDVPTIDDVISLNEQLRDLWVVR